MRIDRFALFMVFAITSPLMVPLIARAHCGSSGPSDALVVLESTVDTIREGNTVELGLLGIPINTSLTPGNGDGKLTARIRSRSAMPYCLIAHIPTLEACFGTGCTWSTAQQCCQKVWEASDTANNRVSALQGHVSEVTWTGLNSQSGACYRVSADIVYNTNHNAGPFSHHNGVAHGVSSEICGV